MNASNALPTQLASRVSSIRGGLLFYTLHSAFLPSITLSLLYLTVLSFGGQMVTYLLSIGYTSTQIGIVRTVSVAFEICTTWIAPVVTTKIGPIRAGLWFINWQTACITAAVGFFLGAQSPLIAASGLVLGVIMSRIGLWGFDICVQTTIQEVCNHIPSLAVANFWLLVLTHHHGL
jgi:solute carrier family 40 (iron-regulated transporter), member 1